MQQRSVHRFFKHKFYKNSVIRSVMRKGFNAGEQSPMYHLYIELVSGEQIMGMPDQPVFMLATSLRQDEWTTILEEWAAQNMYEDYQPHQMTHAEASAFIEKCRSLKASGARLGQAFINELGDKTPTPNIVIFNTQNEQEAIDWLYNTHVQSAA